MTSKKIKILKVIFLLIFTTLVFVGKSINFSAIIGTDNQFFTFYQLVGPIVSRFFGTTFGIITVLIAELIDFLIKGKELTIINLLRLTPMLFATYYFGTKRRIQSAIIPLICIVLFNIHPVGRKAWQFSLYWLIPIIGRIIPNSNKFRMIIQSFGATFTSHAIGSVIWLYTVPMTSSAWLALIPVVAFERIIFGFGITGTFYGTKFLLKKISQKIKIASAIPLLEKELQKEKIAIKVSK